MPTLSARLPVFLVGMPRWGKRQSLAGASEEATEPCCKRKKCRETELGSPEMEELLSGPDWEKVY